MAERDPNEMATSGRMSPAAYGKHEPIRGDAAVLKALDGIQFPVSKPELVACVGEQPIEYTPGERYTLGELIGPSVPEVFHSPEEVLLVVTEGLERTLRRPA